MQSLINRYILVAYCGPSSFLVICLDGVNRKQGKQVGNYLRSYGVVSDREKVNF